MKDLTIEFLGAAWRLKPVLQKRYPPRAIPVCRTFSALLYRAGTDQFGSEIVKIVCLDMEGVIAPEIWIELAERTGIEALRRTTRDEPDYDKLMRYRLDILDGNGLGIAALQPIIDEIEPLPGALAFLDALRAKYQVVILSDTFYEFVGPLMAKMRYPTLFCHRLTVDGAGKLTGYRLRMPDHKKAAVKAFRALNFTVCAAGDSYNDTRMLGAADAGFLFRPPQNVIDEFPQFPVFTDYGALFDRIAETDPHPISVG